MRLRCTFGVAVAALLLFVGCARVAPPSRVGAPPPSPQEISTCKSELSARSVATFLAIGAGAGVSGFGAAAGDEPSSNGTAKTGFQITSIAFGVAAAGVAIAAARINNAYNAHRCDAVLNLP